MRLVLVITDLQSGGAQRVITTLANYWVGTGIEVHLISLEDRDRPSFYALDERVVHHTYALNEARSGRFDVLKSLMDMRVYVRKILLDVRPDAVIAFLDTANCVAVSAAAGLKTPVLISERSNPKLRSLTVPYRILRRLLFPRASTVVILSDRYQEFLPGSARRRAVVIPNPVLVPPPSPADLARRPGHTCLAVGRLEGVKQFDRLIRAFARVSSKHPDWRLDIWGKGSQKEALESLIGELGMNNVISLRGLTQRPHDEMRSADLFVLTSRHEGFPNVLCEAMACGLPVLSFDCPHGPSEIIRNNVDGLLIPNGDDEALVASLDRLMASKAERDRLAAQAPSVLDRLGIETVSAKWMAAIAAATP
jgi:glycosyltransferase involved in cell wall biosynthesis